MTIQKWDFKTKSYKPYEIPKNWHCPLYSDNMEEKINCACCGKEMAYGDGYTSRTIHTKLGMGFYVCGGCFEEEWAKEKGKDNE